MYWLLKPDQYFWHFTSVSPLSSSAQVLFQFFSSHVVFHLHICNGIKSYSNSTISSVNYVHMAAFRTPRTWSGRCSPSCCLWSGRICWLNRWFDRRHTRWTGLRKVKRLVPMEMSCWSTCSPTTAKFPIGSHLKCTGQASTADEFKQFDCAISPWLLIIIGLGHPTGTSSHFFMFEKSFIISRI